MQCIDKEGNEIIIGDTNGDSIAKRQSWREDDCSTCATDSDFNLDELFLMNPGTFFISNFHTIPLRTKIQNFPTNRDSSTRWRNFIEIVWRYLSLIFKLLPRFR